MKDEFLVIEKTLMEGNKRFMSNKLKLKDFSEKRRKDLKENGQRPMAVVVSCSDSRVPPEIIFDLGLGEIFTVRNAGNIVDSNTIGNVEFAVNHLGAKYVLVMGHEKCGAVEAALEGVSNNEKLKGFIEPLENVVANALENNKKCTRKEIIDIIEDKNVEASANKLLESENLRQLKRKDEIEIVKAKYFHETGEVKILR
ncbi:carbonic anhydrase [Clostridium acetobutylicum]|uniref:Carbonic anhydrase n=1 Tax=Clostridium acetobutylicum (strain ATCC 824 / DSM 792 / JCM 1419 / IAM 19013 / LMG 5710 / NBRC 13948 / NRRL B-527 / VKM B-1787 / 2291 / W) TaxID=272562 RepID=Q97G87_CLOAB|nr:MULTISPECIES: carbonic anhydrase [Clostridium]AAK80436.1 Carbonic anhydrase [Clostridium acetobutylicum ATCC 824]ADZ21533.1 Carbonic anhydrase [Clostridium acetobutylicum EA 2018]AEI33840.1 carbonic anhydrase [Clostridium acetobutylicum DSM 1731]AWV79147.1 carbonic anhydrase [Clostridium acetobutylicum]MBC2394890.1 carbonic anhydrase [Clostridium acetobutylicum]